MSRTRHHKNQKNTHAGYEYGGRYKCNKAYSQDYGTDGRKAAHKEMRESGKTKCREGVDLA